MDQADGEPAAERVKLGYRDTITVLVGPAKTSFTVHKLAICTKAPFFEKATSTGSNWTEAKEKTVTLSETEPEVFEAYLHWVYTGEVELSSIVTWALPTPPSYMSVAKLWLFADMMLDHSLCNRVADIAVEKRNEGDRALAVTILSFIWDRTPPSSKLRTLCIDVIGSRRNAVKWLKERGPDSDGPQLPQDFVFELALRHLNEESRHKISKDISRRGICSRYHIHSDGAECRE